MKMHDPNKKEGKTSSHSPRKKSDGKTTTFFFFFVIDLSPMMSAMLASALPFLTPMPLL